MTTCGCVYVPGWSDDSGPQFSLDTWPRARKPHKCCECGETIPVGAKYQRTTGKWESAVNTYKTCEPCVEVRVLLCCEGWIYGNLWSDIDAHFRDGGKPFGCLELLQSVAAKDKLAEAYRSFLGVEE